MDKIICVESVGFVCLWVFFFFGTPHGMQDLNSPTGI